MVWIPTKIRNTPSESSSSMQTDLILDYLISDQQQLNMSDCHVTIETWSWITWWYPDWGGFKVTCRKEGRVSVCWWLTDTSDFHAWTGQSSESRLGSRSRSLCPENRQFQSDCKTYKTYTNWSPTDRYGVYLFPPVALSLMCRAVIPSSLQRWATSWAANMAAYGDDSSLSAFTFIPPVTRQIVSLEAHRPIRHQTQGCNGACSCSTVK